RRRGEHRGQQRVGARHRPTSPSAPEPDEEGPRPGGEGGPHYRADHHAALPGEHRRPLGVPAAPEGRVVTRLSSVLAAYQISVTGWTVLAAIGFLAVFGRHFSNHR